MRRWLAVSIVGLAMLVSALPAAALEAPTRRTWPSDWTGNQGPHPTYVAYAWLALLTTEPLGFEEPAMRPGELLEIMQQDDAGYEPGTTLADAVEWGTLRLRDRWGQPASRRRSDPQRPRVR